MTISKKKERIMWNVYEERFIHNETQEIVTLIIAGIILYEYAPPKAQKLYDNLTLQEKKHIKEVLEKIGEN